VPSGEIMLGLTREGRVCYVLTSCARELSDNIGHLNFGMTKRRVLGFLSSGCS
jgi:hypothetical protein